MTSSIEIVIGFAVAIVVVIAAHSFHTRLVIRQVDRARRERSLALARSYHDAAERLHDANAVIPRVAPVPTPTAAQPSESEAAKAAPPRRLGRSGRRRSPSRLRRLGSVDGRRRLE